MAVGVTMATITAISESMTTPMAHGRVQTHALCREHDSGNSKLGVSELEVRLLAEPQHTSNHFVTSYSPLVFFLSPSGASRRHLCTDSCDPNSDCTCRREEHGLLGWMWFGWMVNYFMLLYVCLLLSTE